MENSKKPNDLIKNDEKLENPSAFPELDWYQSEATNEPVYKTYGGMSLRDYFAAKAMVALLTGEDIFSSKELSKTAYGVADAMLKERQNENSKD